jgi:hypothetical protein
MIMVMSLLITLHLSNRILQEDLHLWRRSQPKSKRELLSNSLDICSRKNQMRRAAVEKMKMKRT